VNPEEFRRTRFDPKDLVSSVIAFLLRKRMQQDPTGVHRVLIPLHNGYGDPESAATKVRKIVDDVFADEKQDGEAVVTRELSQISELPAIPQAKESVRCGHPRRPAARG
jgi:hypothetical protein